MLHVRILLQADASPEGLQSPDDTMAEALGVSLSTIHRVRQRFKEDIVTKIELYDIVKSTTLESNKSLER